MLTRQRKLFASAFVSAFVMAFVSACVMALVVAGIGASISGPETTSYRPGLHHSKVSLFHGADSGSTVQSNNWAGYDEGLLDTGSLATSVSARWTVPTATQRNPGEAEASATWIGIGGGCVNMTSGCSLTDPTLIQAGTEQDVSASGVTSYSAWWEILPIPSVNASITVNPGDTVSVSITGPVVWTIDFEDLTDGQSFTETVPYPSMMDSAEWVEEAPVVISTGGSAPISAGDSVLPDLTSPDFGLATLNGKNPGFTASYEMQMVSTSDQVLATPSAPNAAGDGFNVCTYSSTCTAP